MLKRYYRWDSPNLTSVCGPALAILIVIDVHRDSNRSGEEISEIPMLCSVGQSSAAIRHELDP
jgi:hypothetical protein